MPSIPFFTVFSRDFMHPIYLLLIVVCGVLYEGLAKSRLHRWISRKIRNHKEDKP